MTHAAHDGAGVPDTVSTVSPDLARIYDPVQGDLDAVAHLLRDELSADDRFIGELVAHVLHTKGKLLRPALVCLSALACGGGGAARLRVAGACELIHVASLIHDDVIDAADLRRGRATVNAVWGNQVAVLLGDYLFSKAFHMLASLHDARLAAALAGATVRMSQAEIKQIKYGNTPHTDASIYFDIIAGKTAHLFSAACRCGALTAGASGPDAQVLSEFGLEWGMAFQITDDALDLTATPEQVGKPIGSDIQTGKVTLPVIHALAKAPEPDRRRLEALLDSGSDRHPDAAAEVARILAGSGAIEHALGVARAHAGRAAASLARLPGSPARDSLAALVQFVVARTS
ncbi:MAG: polyprenyl synthetase family protein [Bacillati bacterium ANGP1]|uniref:Polyprenyl synthetase family protein n=1 Tax=Candidatus Segetimicrobium genomatis TaxID=2569760 RepID=A0A537JJ09_9BACT|nr:MAG: polyprenyl synthetase family protein [Terrabacteria group bacterium ANGP1]